eukprot:CAMPEP_0177513532 /NCGR_PEP_ID=MMETSP0369-20130122/43822_1 /TAXON_ID=447022 ORGANISM="Scrippsiella hangoei-like, Strain SHHI-4" /NCGR_SAMPLE_ID=MMETSP0369 /ASSEMBLY_ACC=CAM_ASM_000364 /LENGTH=65 /DNA_ID=CAMNT_0018992139 /DNA_START=121 /DNA_END=318 /DNA_ORIENTATION=-
MLHSPAVGGWKVYCEVIKPMSSQMPSPSRSWVLFTSGLLTSMTQRGIPSSQSGSWYTYLSALNAL